MWLTQLAGQNRMPEARDAFLQAAALDPVFVDAWANLAKWHHLNHDLAGEKELWRKVLTLEPDHRMARQVLGQGG
jgi:Flp pilus assembly protein TadD